MLPFGSQTNPDKLLALLLHFQTFKWVFIFASSILLNSAVIHKIISFLFAKGKVSPSGAITLREQWFGVVTCNQ
jgi:hypothetical protein